MKFTDVAGIMNIPYVAEKVKLSHVAEIVKLSHVAGILEAGSMYDHFGDYLCLLKKYNDRSLVILRCSFAGCHIFSQI